MKARTFVEVPHPLENRELTDLERNLIRLAMVDQELRHLVHAAEHFARAKHPDQALVFTISSHATLLVCKFSEAWKPLEYLARSDERVRSLCGAVSPYLRHIRHWSQLSDFRNSAIAHPFRLDEQKSSPLVMPWQHFYAETAPHRWPDLLGLVVAARCAVASLLAVFWTEWSRVSAVCKAPPAPDQRKGSKTGAGAKAALNALTREVNENLARLGVDLNHQAFHRV